jgi:hypothetical protein
MERALRSGDPPREAQLLAMVDVGGDLRAQLEDLELRLRPHHRDLPCRGLGAGDTRPPPRLRIVRRRLDERGLSMRCRSTARTTPTTRGHPSHAGPSGRARAERFRLARVRDRPPAWNHRWWSIRFCTQCGLNVNTTSARLSPRYRERPGWRASWRSSSRWFRGRWPARPPRPRRYRRRHGRPFRSSRRRRRVASPRRTRPLFAAARAPRPRSRFRERASADVFGCCSPSRRTPWSSRRRW